MLKLVIKSLYKANKNFNIINKNDLIIKIRTKRLNNNQNFLIKFYFIWVDFIFLK